MLSSNRSNSKRAPRMTSGPSKKSLQETLIGLFQQPTEVLGRLVRLLASVRLTVWLLSLSIFLVFAGTWAQIDMGIWTTLKTYFRTFFVFIPFQIFLPRDWNVPGSIPFPGGYVIGALLMINLIAAHATRFKLSRSRAGIFLIHLGLVLLLVGEVTTALLANEANMTIDEGETVRFTEDVRVVELVIIDPSAPDLDKVLTVPVSLLKKGGLIHDALLPFEIQVDAYYENAQILDQKNVPSGNPAADRGTAAQFRVGAIPRPVSSGVGRGNSDLPVAIVTILDRGKKVGTWMTALYFSLTDKTEYERVDVEGKSYWMALRHKRSYKPYAIKLIDFRHDRYMGTNTPRNYSSQIQLIDPKQNENREALIYMNHPLRYRGETFYQASFKSGDSGTILQVVRNPGWLLPYIACTVGALGMLLHFGMSLAKFLRKRTVR